MANPQTISTPPCLTKKKSSQRYQPTYLCVLDVVGQNNSKLISKFRYEFLGIFSSYSLENGATYTSDKQTSRRFQYRWLRVDSTTANRRRWNTGLYCHNRFITSLFAQHFRLVGRYFNHINTYFPLLNTTTTFYNRKRT